MVCSNVDSRPGGYSARAERTQKPMLNRKYYAWRGTAAGKSRTTLVVERIRRSGQDRDFAARREVQRWSNCLIRRVAQELTCHMRRKASDCGSYSVDTTCLMHCVLCASVMWSTTVRLQVYPSLYFLSHVLPKLSSLTLPSTRPQLLTSTSTRPGLICHEESYSLILRALARS